MRRGSATVTVTVTNTGKRAGDEVVQLYLHDEVASVTRPVKELRGFSRIHLKPASQSESNSSSAPLISVLRPRHETRGRTGKFDIMVGASSADIASARRSKWRRSSASQNAMKSSVPTGVDWPSME